MSATTDSLVRRSLGGRRIAASGAETRRAPGVWTRGVVLTLVGAALMGSVPIAGAAVAAAVLCGVYGDRGGLPDIGPLARFELPTVGRIYDLRGDVLIELAREQRNISRFDDIPPVVRDAILATEDKRFFSHDGIDYLSLPRVVGRIRVGAWIDRLTGGVDGAGATQTIFPQGGSTITQQLARGVFLQERVSQENSRELRNSGIVSRVLARMVGPRHANMVFRKREEMRLALWLEEQMQRQFGSKRRAKEEILARYASVVYMGNGQYGFARASEYYLDTPLSALTPDDADRAALLAGIMKSPRAYAPTAADRGAVLRRRNQVLTLMAARGSITREQLRAAAGRPLPVKPTRVASPLQSSAVVEHVLDELREHDLGLDDLLQGRAQVYSTVDLRVQQIVTGALERGLERYEARHAAAHGVVQGAVVVLKNADGGVLAESGGRLVYDRRAPSYSDYNRARQSMRQPGSTMKPIVYLAAFRAGIVTLDTLVPDEPISVPDGAGARKWIANYDDQFKGPLPVRQALAESRNAVAIWLTEQIGIDAVLAAARSLGMGAPLQRYVTTALGASEVTLLDLANAYRAMASGLVVPTYVIRKVSRGPGVETSTRASRLPPTALSDGGIALVQEGLRGVVRLPSGTAHALGGSAFPIAVMGKTGTTNDFRDALFVGSTYGVDGITVAVRIGFDDNRSLGPRETGGRVALPVFRDVIAGIYRDGLAGRAPTFPAQMEQRITRYLQPPVDPPPLVAGGPSLKN